MAGQTVLLVDDDEILLEMLSDHVRTAGYRCLVASSGVTGLQVAADAKPDLMVLDVMAVWTAGRSVGTCGNIHPSQSSC
jgi:DNA-binding response OmpR family regulator